MDFEWVAIALGDVVWISAAFAMGLAARLLGLPPLIGFLATGFLLNSYGAASGEMLEKLSDLGITILLFTVGLKLNLRTLARPQVWAVTSLHTLTVSAVMFGFLMLLAYTGLPLISGIDPFGAALIAFALSFSSTVYVVKVLEDRGEMKALHGRIAVGILIMQDIAAVLFLAVSTGKIPSVWAFLVVFLFPLRPLLGRLLMRVGHGELLVLYGFMMAMGGAEVFELVGLKGDLGALIFGLMVADHEKADELAKTMLGFKDLFLLGFFLSIGLAGQIDADTLLLGVLLAPFIMGKSALFFLLMTRFGLRARTSLLASLNLMNYSEFGLIVAAISAANGWIEARWLIVIAVALSISFMAAAAAGRSIDMIYTRNRGKLRRFEAGTLNADDQMLDIGGATIAVIGMGGIGTGAFDTLKAHYGDGVIGIDIDTVTTDEHADDGRWVLHGDPTDADFWDRVQSHHTLELVMLALPRLASNLAVIEELKAAGYDGRIAVIAKYHDEEDRLRAAGATTVFNIYREAGAGFASHVAALAP